MARTVDGTLHSIASRKGAYLFQCIRTIDEYVICQLHFCSQLTAFFYDISSYESLSPHCFGKHQCRKADRTKTNHQYSVIAGNADFFETFIYSTESACDLGSVSVGQFVGERNTIFFVCQYVRCHASVSLPAIGSAERAGTTYHVSLTAVDTQTASGDVIQDDTVSLPESSHARSAFHDLPGRFMPGDLILVAFRALSQMFMVDSPDITAADSR